jgi:hypothetical protein
MKTWADQMLSAAAEPYEHYQTPERPACSGAFSEVAAGSFRSYPEESVAFWILMAFAAVGTLGTIFFLIYPKEW